MNNSYSSEDLQAADECLRGGRLEEATDHLERVLPDGPEGALATEWLAGIYLWNGQEVRARAAISQRSRDPLTDTLRTKLVQAFMLEEMPLRAADVLPSQDRSKRDPERCLTVASYHASVGNYYYAIGWLLNIPHDEIGPERWLLDPYFQKLWQHFATNDPPAELLRALSMLDEAAGFATIPAKIDRPMEFGIFNRRDLSPKYCPIFWLDIPRGVARINPESCLRHPALFAEFMAWNSSRIEESLSLIGRVVGRAHGRSLELEIAKKCAAAGSFANARSSVLHAAVKSPHAIEEALAAPGLQPIAGAIRDLRRCRDARPEALDELLAVETLSNADEPERALAIIDDLRSAIGELTLLTLKGAIAHYRVRNYEQALDLANAVVERWPDDPVAWVVAADSLRCMARLEDSADMLLSAPPNITSFSKARELSEFVKSFGHEIPIFESLVRYPQAEECLIMESPPAPQPVPNIVRFADLGSGAFTTHLPVVGSLAAGAAFHGMETGSLDDLEEIDWVEVSTRLARKNRFVVRVAGDSMEPTLKRGEFAVFEYHRSPRADGEVVVANIPEFGPDQSGTEAIKRISQDAKDWFISSDNPAYAPFRISKTLTAHPILGIFVAKI
jgi:SOS-response transcriptional repressor LexA/thioredoxin-like negative regulator of GroEL